MGYYFFFGSDFPVQLSCHPKIFSVVFLITVCPKAKERPGKLPYRVLPTASRTFLPCPLISTVRFSGRSSGMGARSFMTVYPSLCLALPSIFLGTAGTH